MTKDNKGLVRVLAGQGFAPAIVSMLSDEDAEQILLANEESATASSRVREIVGEALARNKATDETIEIAIDDQGVEE